MQICYNRHSSIPLSISQPTLTLFYSIPQSIPPLLAHLHWDMNSLTPSVWIGTTLFHSALYALMSPLLRQGWEHLNTHCTPHSGLSLLYCIPHSLPPSSRRSFTGKALLNLHRYCSAWIGALQFHSTRLTPPSGDPAIVWALLNPCRCSGAYICFSSSSSRPPTTPYVYSSFPHSTHHLALLFHTQLSAYGAPLFLVVAPHFSSEYIILPVKPTFGLSAS